MMNGFTMRFLASAVAVGLSAAGSLAQVATYSPFTVTTPNDGGANTLQSQQLPSGVLEPGVNYNFFSINFDWVPNPGGGFNARQWNAIWALTNAPAEPGVNFFADPGPAINARIELVPQFQPGPLRWVGAFDSAVSGSSDVFFNWLQFDAFTTTTWENVSVSFDATPIVTSSFSGDTTDAPTWTRFRDPREGAGDFPSLITNIRYEATPFFVEGDGIYQFTTSTNEEWNGVIAIYADNFDPSDPDANRIDYWVGTAPGTTNFADRSIAFELEEGRQYFFLQTGRRAGDFGEYFGTVQGFGEVTFAIIPSPGPVAILLAGGVLAGMRRRR